MVGYLGLILLYSSFYFNDVERLWKGLVMVFFYSGFDLVWTYIRDKVWYVPVSSLISGLILAIVATPKPSFFWLIFFSLVAVVGKHLLSFGKNRHLLNPASFSMALAAVFIPAVTWWGLTGGGIIWIVLLGGAFILWRQSRWHLTAAFFIAYSVGLLLIASMFEALSVSMIKFIFSQITEPFIIFFATVMLVEPVTSAFSTKRQQIIYGVMVGAFNASMIYLIISFNLPYQDHLIYGLLAGNLLSGLLFLPARKLSSFWFKAVSDRRRFPVLRGDKSVEAVIIGGGIAGISAAYWLDKVGAKTALLEMGNIATSDSGYTTAMATRFLDSADATIKAWDVSEAGIGLLRKTIQEEKINCDWQMVDGIGFCKSNLPEFKKTVRLFQAKDSGVEFLNGNEASGAVGVPVEAAFRKKGSEGQFHIRKFLLGLAKSAERNGALIFEDSEVADILPGKKVVVKTKHGSITADWLVVASGIPPVKFFPDVAKNLSASVSYVINVKFTKGRPFPRSIFWDNLEPYHYFRWVSANELILGGQDWRMKDKKTVTNPHVELENWLKNLCGKDAEFKVVNKWQGSIYSSPDNLPYVGSHSAYGSNTIFLTGWAGAGMANGFLAGNIIADIVQKKENKFHDLFSFNRFI